MARIRSAIGKALKIPAALSILIVLAGATHGHPSTLENLQTAFNGESNAHARYVAFAQRADAEGYGEVASLFRAAARAEAVHAANHAVVIKEMGADPKSQITTADVKSTRENLQTAIRGESYERDTMYPDFLKQARADHNSSAVRTFNLAKTAETEHAKLYTAALKHLDNLKSTQSTSYYVCPVCGFTVRVVDFSECPSCFTPQERFEKVS